MAHSRIWNERIFRIKNDTFLFFENAEFSYLKWTLSASGTFFVFQIGSFFIFEIATYFIFEDGTFRFLKLPISFLIIRRLRDKVTWQILTFEMLAFEIQWNLSAADTTGTSRKCPLQRGVRYIEVLLKLALLLQILLLSVLELPNPYSPISLPLLKLIKLMGQRNCVITTSYI